jgi:serine phosphatase RsbU (regulator of sigma subunit)
VTKSSFKKFMATIAYASLLSDFELQREQELAKARAIQIGMLPQAALRTADRAICHSFHPFHEVGGDFLDFFTLTDGAIGIYLGDVTGKRLPAALYAALAVGTFRGVHKTGAPPRGWRGQCCCRRAEIGCWMHRLAVVFGFWEPSGCDSVIFLSDGFCLAQNSEGEFFGMESVLEVCENSRENSPEEILQQLTEAVVSYWCGRPQPDDRTAAILRYIGK